MDIQAVWRSDQKLRAATGLRKYEAIELLNIFSEKIENIESRKRKVGGDQINFRL